VYTRKASRSNVYAAVARNSHQMNRLPNIRFAIVLISLFVDRAAKTYERNGKTNSVWTSPLSTATEEFTSKEFKYILSACTRYNPFLAPFTIQQPWHSMKLHLFPFYPSTVTDEPQCVRRIPHCGTLPARFAM